MYTLPFSFRFFSQINYHRILGSLCYTAGPQCPVIPYNTVCLCQSQTPVHPFSPTLRHLSSWQPQICFQSLWVCFFSANKFIWFHLLDSTYKWYHMILVWLTSLNMIDSRSVFVAPNGIILVFFYGWVLVHCIYVPHLLYSLLCRWTLKLLPCLGYYKYCCNEHWGACIFLNYGFLAWMPRSGIAAAYGSSIFSFFCFFFFENLFTVFCSGWTNLQYPTVWKGSLFSVPFPAFFACSHFDSGWH